MEILMSVAFVICALAVLALVVRGLSRNNASLRSSMQQVPDDLRRADDGLDGTGADGVSGAHFDAG